VSGTHPKVTIANDLVVNNGSTLRFELPAAGYDAASATSANPLVDVGDASGDCVSFDETSRLELTGCDELLEYQKTIGGVANYVLMRAMSLDIPDAVLTEARSQLPDGMKLVVKSGEGFYDLVLKVSSNSGMILIVR